MSDFYRKNRGQYLADVERAREMDDLVAPLAEGEVWDAEKAEMDAYAEENKGVSDEQIQKKIDYQKQRLADLRENQAWDKDTIAIVENIIRKSERELKRRQEERGAVETHSEANANELSEGQKTGSEISFRTDHQGNPIDANGKFITESVDNIDELTDEDFINPQRTVVLPTLPENIADAIGTDGKPVIIKKNVFEKNRNKHDDLTPEQSREILRMALYMPSLYGKNQATTRPANWILIHLAKKNSALVLEVDHNKDNCEVVNWHFIEKDGIERKKKRAIEEGGRILTLESAVANTHDNLLSEGEVNTSSSEKQTSDVESSEVDLNSSDFAEIRKTAEEWSRKLGVPIKIITRVEDIENDEALAQVMVSRTSGWYDTGTGEVCIFTPHLLNTAEVELTVIHEVVAHKGMRALLGQKGYAAFLNGVWKSMTPEQQRYWLDYPGVNGNFQAAADEFVAHYAEYEDIEGNRGVWDRIVTALKTALRRMGFNVSVSEAELGDVLKQAYRNLNSKKGKVADGGESGMRFSTHGTFLGIGAKPVFETREDGNRKMSIRIGDKMYDSENPITVEELKADEYSPLSMMVEDARKKSISEDVINQCYESYASLVNLYLEYGNNPEIGSEALMATFLYLGDMASKPIATNSDSQYSLSQDITRICKKNEQMIRCIRELSKQQKWGATPAQIIDLFRTIDKEGLQTLCPVCYVFSRYLNSGKFATGLRDTFLAYQDKLQDISKIKDKEALVEYYNFVKSEFDKWSEWNATNKKLIDQATVDSKVLLLEIDQLGMKLMNYSLGKLELTPEQAQTLENKMQTLSDRYMAAIAIMGRAERAKVIKNAIFTGQTDSAIAANDYEKAVKCLRKGGHLFWHEDFGSPAPDINLTRRYPGYAAYRAAKGAAAGKIASGPSDYSFGDVSLGMGASKDHNTQFLLGGDKARKEKAFSAKVREFDENNNLVEYNDKGEFIGYSDYDNYYIKASLAYKMEKDPKKAKDLFDKWRKKARTSYNNAYNRAQKQNLKGGTRMWSWSDFIPSLGGDMLMAEIENALLGVGVQAYSKQTEGIDLCGKLGIFINGSLIGDGNGYVEVSESDIIEKDGELVDKNPRMVWDPETNAPGQFYEPVVKAKNGKYLKLAFDEKLGVKLWGSIDEKTGNYQLGLFDLMQMHDTVNSITVGMNDIHIKLLLRSKTFDFVIPWHSSGNDNHVLTQMMSALGVNLRGFNPRDYQSIQSEHRIGEAVKKSKGEVADEDSMTEEEKEAAEAARINASKNVSQDVADFWESHKYNKYDSGFGEIPSFKIENGVMMISDEQLAYRKLHDKIIKGGANRNSKVFIKPGTAEYEVIMKDEFLRQTYLTIRDSKVGTLSGAETHMVYPYEYWDKTSTRDNAYVNSERYLEYCRRLGIIPKFCGIRGNQQMGPYGNFADEPGYWKLLIDRRMYDRAGNFQDMQSVSVNGVTGKDIEEKEMRKRHAITELANDDKLSDIIDKTLEMSRDRLRRNASGKYVTREAERNAKTKAEKGNTKIIDGTINYDATGEDVVNAYAQAIEADKIAGDKDANLTKFISLRMKTLDAKIKEAESEGDEGLVEELMQQRDDCYDAIAEIMRTMPGEMRFRTETDNASVVDGQKISTEERQDLTTTIRSTMEDGTKLIISKEDAKNNLEDIAKKFKGRKSTRGFIGAISMALGYPEGVHKQSFYFDLTNKEGEPYTLRVSNHNVNSEYADKRELSIIIKSRRKPNEFRDGGKAVVKEYVYFKESIKNSHKDILPMIAQDIMRLIDTGEYQDSSGIAELNLNDAARQQLNEIRLRFRTKKDGYKALKEEGGESTTRFRVVAPGISTSEMGMAQALYEARVATRGYQVKEALQDSMLGLRACYDAIEKSLGRKREVWEISDDENAYTFENRMSSMNAVQQKEYEERFIKPLLKEVDKLTRGRNKGDRATMYADLVSYMMAKHGLERDRVMREIRKYDSVRFNYINSVIRKNITTT